MSSRNKVDVICPKCSENQKIIVWTSMNVSLDSRAKQDLFEDNINVLKCQKCGGRSPIQTNLLYHDMEREFCALYFPFSMIAEGNLAFEFNQYGQMGKDEDFEGEAGKNQPYDYMNHIHVVFDMEELKKYVVFREKLFEDYKELEVTNKVAAKLNEIQDKVRKGEIETNDKPIYIYPEDLN